MKEDFTTEERYISLEQSKYHKSMDEASRFLYNESKLLYNHTALW
jgi:hypothetical protein